MGSAITSPPQEVQKWRGRSLRSRDFMMSAQRGRRSRQRRSPEGDDCGPFGFSEAKKYASRPFPKTHNKTAQQWMAKAQIEDAIVRGLSIPLAVLNTEARFRWLADEWSAKTMHISSVSDLMNDARYQQIIGLGWDVLPFMLDDLQKKKRFWFPVLAAITGVRPFDPADLSSPRRMTEAWLNWGRRKGLID